MFALLVFCLNFKNCKHERPSVEVYFRISHGKLVKLGNAKREAPIHLDTQLLLVFFLFKCLSGSAFVNVKS